MQKEGRKALVNFITAGFPTIEDTVPILKNMQEAGVDIIELGVPFSDQLLMVQLFNKLIMLPWKTESLFQKFYNCYLKQENKVSLSQLS